MRKGKVSCEEEEVSEEKVSCEEKEWSRLRKR